MKTRRVVVGLSGGVDSAVTAWLLKQQGHEVVGVFMKNWEDDDRLADPGDDRPSGPDDDPPGSLGDDRTAGSGNDRSAGSEGNQLAKPRTGNGPDGDRYCSSNADFIDAAAVADVIGIDIEHVNFAADYKERVFAEFLREYEAGRTPNPDVLCNAEIKFKAFLDHAMRLGADRIATGHYARVRERDGRVELLKGLDPLKDQSYFLHRLTQTQLSKTLFPVGELHKGEVRRLAAEIGLPVATKRDSTGICFIGERPFREFLGRYLANHPGPIKDDRGRTIGEHVGLSFYTLGQRKGIGIGGLKERGAPRGSGDHAPWFVARKDIATNTLCIVQGHDHPWLLSHRLHADDTSWVAGHPPAAGTLAAKTRYRQHDAGCDFVAGSDAFALHFEAPQWAVTPGQSAVVYDGEICLGGGVIGSAEA